MQFINFLMSLLLVLSCIIYNICKQFANNFCTFVLLTNRWRYVLVTPSSVGYLRDLSAMKRFCESRLCSNWHRMENKSLCDFETTVSFSPFNLYFVKLFSPCILLYKILMRRMHKIFNDFRLLSEMSAMRDMIC